MTHTDVLTDPTRALADLVQRIAALERANPLANASLSRGLARVIDSSGNPVVGLGHANGASGMLFYSGGTYVTFQTWTAQQIAAGLVAPNFRLSQLESSMNEFGPRLIALEATVAALLGTVSGLQSSVSSLQSSSGNANANINAIHSQLSSVTNSLRSLIDYVEGLDNYVRSQHPSKPVNPPPTKPITNPPLQG